MRTEIVQELFEEISRVANEHGDQLVNAIPKDRREAYVKGKLLTERYYAEASERLRERGIMVPESFDFERLQKV